MRKKKVVLQSPISNHLEQTGMICLQGQIIEICYTQENFNRSCEKGFREKNCTKSIMNSKTAITEGAIPFQWETSTSTVIKTPKQRYQYHTRNTGPYNHASVVPYLLVPMIFFFFLKRIFQFQYVSNIQVSYQHHTALIEKKCGVQYRYLKP